VYTLVGPLSSLLRRLLPDQITTTARLGRAMIQVAATGYEKPILYTRDINALAGGD
jgi:hypothetical protein